jgi:hypothetical protein
MDTSTLDQLRLAYKTAVDQWVTAIRAEENLATSDHSETAWEKWDAAGFAEEDAQDKAKQARDAYKDGLREANIGF